MRLTIKQAENFTKGILALNAVHKYISYGVEVVSRGLDQDPKPEILLTAHWKIDENLTYEAQEVLTAGLIQRIPTLERLSEEIIELMKKCHVQLTTKHCTLFEQIRRREEHEPKPDQ